jgi:glycosyltransferase involved in cell wall biosynthesis
MTSPQKNKILHVVNVFFVLPYFIGDQFDYFKNKGYKLFVACTPSVEFDNYSNEKKFSKIKVNISRNFNFFNDLITIFKLIYAIKKNNIEIVVGHTPKGGYVSMIAAFLCQTEKRIYFRHGLMFETSSGIKKQILILIEKLTGILATDVISVSQSVLEKSISYRLDLNSKNRLLGNGTCNGIDSLNKWNPVNIKTLDKLEKRKSLKIKHDDLVVGFVGRIVRDKGINELICAWKILKSEFNNIKLVLVGPIELRDSIDIETQKFIENDETIIFQGFIKDTEIYYSIFDIFILPSYREGFPTVVLEASSMMLPIITTRNTGCRDSICENITGIFCDISDNSIYEKIKFYILNPQLRLEHGKNGREFVVKNFQQNLLWSEIEKLYH